MKHVKKSVLLWYSPREMYDLVVDAPSYPKFLPWCQKGEVLSEDDEGLTARLHLAYAGVKHAFTTRNRMVPARSLTMALVDGPFSHLLGEWRFTPLGPAAAAPDAEPKACKVEFDLSYAFSSRPLEAVVSPVFDKIANTFVDAFVARAEAVYGRR
ncbi:MAG TPA: type II toxin-antitoxin system RatA family toxin [Burkholderiaceae bacterium]|nr:type II toxin-antitoxin system RatA family toxin [Burkholderiaceae bacterium]HMZ02894.1 type II toxin-antitoxin system RatA family toxin [Burkholderiaceae bacterium]HNB44556.1 type II toxin-antitoxin system RatA family toxin [Burkholderiaceae bacterium]HNG81721.1 type II toxin-antitoxin system RatA family toxin [Burkholderiaceae bacterium]